MVFSQQPEEFSFVVTCDMREFSAPEYQSSEYFLGACEAISEAGKGEFMISPGDIDPPWYVLETISQVLGEDYLWYPVIGNHEAETPEDMAYLRGYNALGIRLPFIVNKGPDKSKETMYSFDYGNAHFVVINNYFDGKSDIGTDGDIVDETYQWLYLDLSNTQKECIFVFGHEPAFPLPDMDTGRLRHVYDSLNKYTENRDRFWKLLKDKGVVAYVCGHTHNTSIEKIDGVYQIDAGHSRGIGDKGAPSTFIKINIKGNSSECEIYRLSPDKGEYFLRYSCILE
jgi:predicted phosphodiesterase